MMYDGRLSSEFQSYLLTAERVLWSGQPKQGLALSGKDALLIPFSLLWGGFAFAWNAGVWFAPFGDDTGAGSGLFFKLWGLPFLVVGIYLIFGRFLHDAYLRKQLVYAVSDRRVMILRGARFSSLDVNRLPRLDLDEHRDGTGTLAFESGPSMFLGGRQGFGFWVPALDGTAKFFRIEKPRTVYELVRKQSTT
jgi:hypothetical protein